MADLGINTVIWAMGYRPDLGWVDPPILDAEGYPDAGTGVTAVPAVPLGLDWLHTAKSGLFAGSVEHVATLPSTCRDTRSSIDPVATVVVEQPGG